MAEASSEENVLTNFPFFYCGVNKMDKMVKEKGRINVILPPDLNERLDKYIIGLFTHKGKIIDGIKTKIARKALEEWLDRNENNYDIEF